MRVGRVGAYLSRKVQWGVPHRRGSSASTSRPGVPHVRCRLKRGALRVRAAGGARSIERLVALSVAGVASGCSGWEAPGGDDSILTSVAGGGGAAQWTLQPAEHGDGEIRALGEVTLWAIA